MIEQMAKQIIDDVQRKFTSTPPDASQLKVILESALRKLNLVTREEFDTQQAVLAKTRQKLDELEAKLATFQSDSKANGPS